MAKKKSKEKPSTPPANNAVSPKASVFTSIFNTSNPSQNAVALLFSDTNPFKRKPQNDDVAIQPKKSKLDVDVQVIAETQEPEIHEKSVEPDSDSGTKVKRKKRKRDELESAYEGKRYGVVVETEPKRVGEKRKKVEDPAELMVTKEGFDDESKLLRTVFVGNLPLSIKKKTLVKEFSKFGEVESVRIRSVPLAADTKKPRKGAIMLKQISDTGGSVNGYIVFKTEESANASLVHNMVVVGGNHIRVDRACPPRKKLKGESTQLYDHKRTVFVGNLPFDVKDEEVYQLFCSVSGLESSVEAIRVVRDPKVNIGKGIAYVLLKTKEAAIKLVKKKNLKLRGRDLRLSLAKADATPTKRKSPSTENSYNLPSKRADMEPKTPESSNRLNVKNPMSYQGMRANKSGSSKNSTSYQGIRATKSGSSKKIQTKRMGSGSGSVPSKKVEKSKDSKGKRPAVAARKAKQRTLNDGAPSQNGGKKRKMESRTPETTRGNKKSKKLR